MAVAVEAVSHQYSESPVLDTSSYMLRLGRASED